AGRGRLRKDDHRPVRRTAVAVAQMAARLFTGHPPVHHRAAVSAAGVAARLGAYHEVARPALDNDAALDCGAFREGRAAAEIVSAMVGLPLPTELGLARVRHK